MGDRISIHCNASLAHQRIYAAALLSGFQAHGEDAFITDQKTAESDIKVLMGPWFALKENVSERVWYLDRAYWGDPLSVSVCFLTQCGDKEIRWGNHSDRYHPELQPEKIGGSKVVLCDYGMTGQTEREKYKAHTIRRHPSEQAPTETLDACFEHHSVAIGRQTSALVYAAIRGLRIITEDRHSPVRPLATGETRENWIRDLAGHNWSLEEIGNGEAWEFFDVHTGRSERTPSSKFYGS